MGVWGWQVSLLLSASRTEVMRPALSQISRGKGVDCPTQNRPWSADSRLLALVSWERGLTFFDMLLRTCRPKRGIFPIGCLQWSPKNSFLLVYQRHKFFVLDDDGRIVSKVSPGFVKNEVAHAGWLPRGDQFFIIGRETVRSRPRIFIIEASTGKSLEDHPLDPAALLPYDEGRYRKIPRAKHSLLFPSSSTMTVGACLDIWTEMVYRPEDAAILLSTCRPAGAPITWQGHSACRVEQKWISVRLSRGSPRFDGIFVRTVMLPSPFFKQLNPYRRS